MARFSLGALVDKVMWGVILTVLSVFLALCLDTEHVLTSGAEAAAEAFIGQQPGFLGALQGPPWAAPLRAAAQASTTALEAFHTACPSVGAGLVAGEGPWWLRSTGTRAWSLGRLPAPVRDLLADGADTPDAAVLTVPAGTAGLPLDLRASRPGLFKYVMTLKGGEGASITAVDPSGAKPAPTAVSATAPGVDLYADASFDVTVSTGSEPVTLLLVTRRAPIRSITADALNRFLLWADYFRDDTLKAPFQQSRPAWGCAGAVQG